MLFLGSRPILFGNSMVGRFSWRLGFVGLSTCLCCYWESFIGVGVHSGMERVVSLLLGGDLRFRHYFESLMEGRKRVAIVDE